MSTYATLGTNVTANGICLVQAPPAGALSLNGALVTNYKIGKRADIEYASKLTLTSAGNLSTVSFTIKGEDYTGNVIEEVIAGPNATTVNTVDFFKNVTSIIADAASAQTVTVGTNAESALFIQADAIGSPMVGLGANVSAAATLQYTFQFTNDKFGSDYSWQDVPNMTANTADFNVKFKIPCTAYRVKLDSWSAGDIDVSVVSTF